MKVCGNYDTNTTTKNKGGNYLSHCTSLLHYKYYIGVFILYVSVTEIEYLYSYLIIFPRIKKKPPYIPFIQTLKAAVTDLKGLVFSYQACKCMPYTNKTGVCAFKAAKIDQESCQIIIFCDLLMPFSVVNATVIRMPLNMDKPSYYSVDLEDECLNNSNMLEYLCIYELGSLNYDVMCVQLWLEQDGGVPTLINYKKILKYSKVS